MTKRHKEYSCLFSRNLESQISSSEHLIETFLILGSNAMLRETNFTQYKRQNFIQINKNHCTYMHFYMLL